jgi:Ca2+:H+ antiporter
MPRDCLEERSRMPKATPALRNEWSLPVIALTTALFLAFGKGWLADLSGHNLRFVLLSAWLFGAMMMSAFGVVHHAETLAQKLGEPFGTLILTLAVTGMEVMMIAALMYAGGDSASMLARDAMFAVVMIVLNGMVGLSLIVGGLRYHEQAYNLQGANAFLAVIMPLAALGLVLPNVTVASPGPTLSGKQAAFLIFMSLVLYGVFLAIQTLRHRDYFIGPEDKTAHSHARGRKNQGSVPYHTVLLLLYAAPVVILSKQMATPINHVINALGAPPALAGFVISVLILSPESLGATRAALANELQRSVNILLGSVLASISLTIPCVLTLAFLTHRTVVLGLDAVDTLQLILALGLSMITFASERTNVLLGAVHLLLFLTYLMLLFER